MVEFRDQIQYTRTDLPEMGAKIEQYKQRIAALTTLYARAACAPPDVSAGPR